MTGAPTSPRSRLRAPAVVALLVAAGVIALINRQDHAHDPATDNADAVAVAVVVVAGATWLALSRLDDDQPGLAVVTAVAGGAALGAIIVGLVSVVFDPWACDGLCL